MDYTEIAQKKLQELEQEHRELNEAIANPDVSYNLPEFTLQRLKKRKLLIKDEIEKLKPFTYPDIIA